MDNDLPRDRSSFKTNVNRKKKYFIYNFTCGIKEHLLLPNGYLNIHAQTTQAY